MGNRLSLVQPLTKPIGHTRFLRVDVNILRSNNYNLKTSRIHYFLGHRNWEELHRQRTMAISEQISNEGSERCRTPDLEDERTALLTTCILQSTRRNIPEDANIFKLFIILKPQFRLNNSLNRHVPANRNLALGTWHLTLVPVSCKETGPFPCKFLSIHIHCVLTHLISVNNPNELTVCLL